MANIDLCNYRFIGMVVPAGIPEDNPKKLVVSVCFNINKYCSDFITTDENGNPLPSEKVKENYNSFVTSLRKFKKEFEIPVSFQIDKKTIKSEKAKTPFEYFLKNKENPNYDDVKKKLWGQIFPENIKTEAGVKELKVNIDSKVKIYDNSAPDKLLSEQDNNLLKNTIHLLDEVATMTAFKAFQDNYNPEKSIVSKLNKINEFGKNRIKIAEAEFNEFYNRVHNNDNVQAFLMNENNKNEFIQNEKLDPVSPTLKLYVDHSYELEMDEVVHSFSKIADDPILSRLMGITVDYLITFDDKTIIRDGSEISIAVQLDDNNSLKDCIYFLPTPITIISPVIGKYAYLIKPKPDLNYFEYSILKKDLVTLQTVDSVSQVLKNEDYRSRINKGQAISNSDRVDALTRGILFTHSELDKIIASADILKKDSQGNIVCTIDPETIQLHDEHFIRGHRVVIKSRSSLYPLTTRGVKIETNDFSKSNIYENGDVASCIHFDSPMAYMEDGEVKSTTSNVLFEYSGELLKLKTAFAKAYKPKKIDHSANTIRNLDDDGLKKSEERWNKAIRYYLYPNRKPSNLKEQPLYNCFYDIPKQFENGDAPKLRFYKKPQNGDDSNQYYTFLVHQEYLNGWGLPLNNAKNNDAQLTISDLIDPHKESSPYLPDSIPFRFSENKKAPILVHKRKVVEELKNNELSQKPSLEHLIVRSDNGDDSIQDIDERHILPPKIDLETAFWHGLLSPPNLSPLESYDLKTKSNCPFTNLKDRNSIDNKNKRCPECNKMSYCGGTQLKDYYPQDSFTPPFITDPTIDGLKIGLFWELNEDKKIKNPCFDSYNKQLTASIDFDGIGIGVKSYLLVANGAKDESILNPHRKFIELSLKKGAELYAELTNRLTDQGKDHVRNGLWIKQFKSLFIKNDNLKFLFQPENQESKEVKNLYNLIEEISNTPKIIKLTHAVKEPLITPEVIKLTSTPKDHKFIEHINDWLKEKDYQRYKVGINIISNRIDKTTGDSIINTSFTKVELTSHFERLDAIRKIEFLKDVIPTGALELWMRKEEFIDNPDQIVLASKSDANHIPSEPVVSFKNRKNVFNLDYKIEFSNEMMSQLKSLKNIEDIDSIFDVFRSLITKLNLQYDFKTTKFEEREYCLKDISKFKGFFTDEKFNDNGDVKAINKLEEFALPKFNDVMSDLDEDSKFRFKVIVLNNSQPPKPDVAFAVTTIQETRTYTENKKTVSIQKGNIVTIYLKRGRLKSGKDERVGIIVNAASLYNKIFKDNNLISKAGRDIVSDRFSNRSEYLQHGDIVVPELNDFKADYDNELGIYHFLPQFDIEKQLWKFEVELDIKTLDGKQLHNPFINFSIVHFQPFSINYNDKTADTSLLELKNDCRISDVENSTWCYLLPERKLSVYIYKPGMFDAYGEVDLTVSFDHESLHHSNFGEKNWKVRSNFIATVQGSESGQAWDWHSVGSRLDDEKLEVDNSTLSFHHPLLSKNILDSKQNLAKLKLKFNKWAIPNDTVHSNPYSYFRVRFIEVEWFTNETWDEVLLSNKELLSVDVVDNEEMRIRFVELIY